MTPRRRLPSSRFAPRFQYEPAHSAVFTFSRLPTRTGVALHVDWQRDAGRCRRSLKALVDTEELEGGLSWAGYGRSKRGGLLSSIT
jgi:hypothetical protein